MIDFLLSRPDILLTAGGGLIVIAFGVWLWWSSTQPQSYVEPPKKLSKDDLDELARAYQMRQEYQRRETQRE